MTTKNILIFSTTNKHVYFEGMGYRLPIGCGGLQKNIILNLNILKKFFNVYLILRNSTSSLGCSAKNINVIHTGTILNSKILSYAVLFRELLRKEPFHINRLEKEKTVVFVPNDIVLSLLTKLLQPKLTVIYSMETEISKLIWRPRGNLLLKIMSLFLFILNAIVIDKLTKSRKIPWKYEKYFKILKNKSCFLPNVINKELFNPHEKKIDLPGINKDDILLLYVGRITDVAYKNPVLLFRSFDLISKKIKNIKLMVLGAGNKEGSKLIKKFNVKNKENIFFLGTKSNEETVQYYQRCDLTLLTSLSEGNPYVILESLACGTPCITTDIVDEGVIQDGVNGFISKSYKPEDFTEVVLKGLELSHRIKPQKNDLLSFSCEMKNREEVLLELLS